MRVFRSAVILTAIILLHLCSGRAQEIGVSTDKQVYSSGEDIKITVKNLSSISLFSQAAGATPDFAISNVERKLSRWSWDAFRPHCGRPECDIDFDQPREIRAGKSVSFQWKPRIYSEKKYAAPQPGLWRMTFIYQIRKDNNPKNWSWRTVKSNEFTLR